MRAHSFIRICILCLMYALLVASAQVHAEDFGNRAPSEDEIIKALVPKRGLKVGAGSSLFVRPSISMEMQFRFNSAAIDPAYADRLSTLAKALNGKQLQAYQFEMVGHTDAVGSDGFNQYLSERRAASVRQFLVAHGVSAERLTARGKGETELKNRDVPGAAENRRVQVFTAARIPH